MNPSLLHALSRARFDELLDELLLRLAKRPQLAINSN